MKPSRRVIPWLPEELTTLRDLWQRNATRETLTAALPRHDWDAIVYRGRREALPLVPPGWVTVAAGARRAGYSRPAWVRLLRAWGVRTRPHPRLAYPGARRPRAHRIHSWAAAERHLGRLLAAETLTEAAVRLDVSVTTLHRHARAAGLYHGNAPGVRVRHPPAAWTEALYRHRRKAAA